MKFSEFMKLPPEEKESIYMRAMERASAAQNELIARVRFGEGFAFFCWHRLSWPWAGWCPGKNQFCREHWSTGVRRCSHNTGIL